MAGLIDPGQATRWNGVEYETYDPAAVAGGVTGLGPPSALIGMTMVPGSGSLAMPSDAAPALDPGIVPSWTGQHTFAQSPVLTPLTASRVMVTDGFKKPASSTVSTTALNAAFALQTANTFFAGPSAGGSASPGFRAIVAADVPALSYEPPLPGGGTTSQYLRGDKSWQTLNKAAVGLSNVENTTLSTWAGSADLTTLGTVTVGTWQSTLVGVTYGGTGANLAATGGSARVLKQLSAGAAVTVAQLAASELTNGTTGSGAVVLQNSPTLILPNLGVATATSVNKVIITAPATASTLTLANGKTFTVSNTLTLSGTDAKALTLTGSLTVGADASIAGGGTLALGGFTFTIPGSGTAVLTSRTITAGVGLTGGGDLSADRTVAMGTPSTLTVSTTNSASGTTHTHAITSTVVGAVSTLLATDASGITSLAGLTSSSTTFNLANTTATTVNFAGAATALNVGNSAGSMTVNSGTLTVAGTLLNPGTGYTTDIGQLAKKFRTLYAAELVVQTLVAFNTVATIGGRVLVGPTTSLIADLSAVSTTIDVKHNQMSNGDRVYIEAGGAVEFFAVTSSATPITGGYRYTVSRNLDGSGANAFSSGEAVFNTGQTGSGWIDLYSFGSMKPGVTQTGPTIVGNVRSGTTYNAWAENWAIGNLLGVYGYGSAVFGVGFGEYAAGKTHVTIDSTNGYRTFSGLSTVVQQIDAAGVITVGEVAAGKSNILISSGVVQLRNNTAVRAQVAADGSAFFGSGNLAVSAGGVLTVGSWTVNSATLTGTSVTLDCAGKLTLGTGTDVAVLDAVDATYRLAIGHSTYSSAPFRVTKAGAVTATSGVVGGWTLSSTSLTSGTGGTSVGMDSGGTNPAFYAGSATPGAAPFRVTNAGAMTAMSGVVGGWTINSSFLSSGGITLAANAAAASNKIYVGAGNYNNADTAIFLGGDGKVSFKDKFTWDGTTLTITGGGTFSGTLSAATGTFAGALSAATAGGGEVLLNASGISIAASNGAGGLNVPTSLKWIDAGVVIAEMFGYKASASNSEVSLSCCAGASPGNSSVILWGQNSIGTQLSRLQLISDSTPNNYALLDGIGTFKGLSINGGIPVQMLDVRGSGYFSGSIGIGNTSPATPLDIVYNNNAFGFGVSLRNTNAGATALAGFGIDDTTGANRLAQFMYVPSNYTDATIQNTLVIGPTSATGSLILWTNGAQRVRVSSAGAVRFVNYGAGTLSTDGSGNITASDERLKIRVADFTPGLEAVRRIQPFSYRWKAETDWDTLNTYHGFGAHEVEGVIPGATGLVPKVAGLTDARNIIDRTLIAVSFNALRELDSRGSAMEDGLAALKEENRQLRQRLEYLEGWIPSPP